ncbi:MAG: type VI secretion system tube protein TssD [Myxococcota bacterium]
MALSVHLFMKANGTDVHGDSTVTSMERADSIECVAYNDHVATQRRGEAGVATGRRVHDPIVITKRIDKSTPLLLKALCQNEVIEGDFKFYRPAPTGDGSTEHFMTVEIREARIVDIKREVLNVLDRAVAQYPVFETVSFMFSSVEVRYEPDGVSHQDLWTEQV